MGARPVILLSLALGIAGFLAGRLAARGGAAEPPPPAGNPAGPAPAPARPAPEGAIPPDRDLTPVRFARTFEAPRTTAGLGQITGRVRDEAGAPLGGVTIVAVPRGGWLPSGVGTGPPIGDPGLPDALAELRYTLLRRAGTRRAGTGDDGRFAVGGLSQDVHDVSAYKRGFELRPMGGHEARPGAEVEFIGRRVFLLTCDVRGPSDAPPERARIDIGPGARYVRRSFVWTPAHPRIPVDRGITVEVRAVAGWDEEFASDPLTLDSSTADERDPVVLVLKPRHGILGTVTFPPGDPVNWSIRALRVREDGNHDPTRLLSERHAEGRLRRCSPRAGTGAFFLPDLAPGLWLVAIVAGGNVLASAEVRVAEGNAPVALVVPFPSAGEAVTVRVLTPDGRPPGDHDVSVHGTWRPESGCEASGGQAAATGGGLFRVPRPALPGAAGGTYSLLVRSRAYGEKTVEYDPDATGEITVRFDEPAVLAVRVAGYAGSRLEGAAVLAVGRQERRPDAAGRLTFDPLAPGEHSIVLYAEGNRHGRSEIARRTIRLTTGTTEETIDPPALFELLVEAGEGAAFRIESLTERFLVLLSEPAPGGAAFLRLARGDYLLTSQSAVSQGAMPLRIEGDMMVRFDPRPLNALRVRIDDPRGLLGAAGLLNGDLVTAIDGTEITDAAQAAALRSIAREGEPSRLTVSRRGRTLAVSVDLRAAWDRGPAGGDLRPWVR
ncbi:MAG: hypothetical protein MUE73_13445 [Planctomycetes bacterium]|jgi:hypothetical protein|nr:hypothetical protein [Planctomycetota bacterium]